MAFDGKYVVAVESLLGNTEGEIILKTEGDEVKATINALGISAEAYDVKVKDNVIRFKVEADVSIGHVKAKVKCEVNDGHISGKLSSGIVEATFEGDRV